MPENWGGKGYSGSPCSHVGVSSPGQWPIRGSPSFNVGGGRSGLGVYKPKCSCNVSGQSFRAFIRSEAGHLRHRFPEGAGHYKHKVVRAPCGKGKSNCQSVSPEGKGKRPGRSRGCRGGGTVRSAEDGSALEF